ncbi:ABC transporter ATP-binding protein [Sphaerochaeta halotolerans]|uniref:ABC transporter ATP-binding protein n=1 Tax=Sphaerochaeta halotolerans TaxID=2293840 RepID=A0A372MDD3_9SPIR|nr:ABC transporter ATP-binding protein [Sphaerochaeta halotolerans]RFU93807.1 ABC transporter ATP-binding protein [Sphaerochaeta halotolerans]
MHETTILQVEGLVTEFKSERGIVNAVNKVSFDLERGQTLGIVGESGSGKSVTNLSILRLIEYPPGRITGGKVLFHDQDLLSVSENEMLSIRGKHISMIFQDPLTSLNPVIKVWKQIAETLMLHQGMKKQEAKKQAIELLRIIGIPDPEMRAECYPHQFSGGMRQRVMIAMALSCNPDILIADEPTTALDVTIQAQILDLIREKKEQYQTSVIMITHDLGVIAEMCDQVCVMYAGRIVERAGVEALFGSPKHPYTRGLLESIPRMGNVGTQRLHSIKGSPPDLANLPPGCPFRDRCDKAMDICASQLPPEVVLQEAEGERTVACWLYPQEGKHGRA